MKRTILLRVVGSLIALILGIAVAYPLFVSDFPSLSKLDISVDVAYAYIAPLSADSNLTGLSWNNSTVEVTYSGGVPGGVTKADGLVVSYIVVLNVTNNSNESARIRSFNVIVGPQVSVGSGGSVSAGNAVLTDSRHYGSLLFDDELWSPHTSRLIGLTGAAGVHETPYASLKSAVYLYGSVEGGAEKPGQTAEGYSLKQVQLQTVGDGYLYNTLLNSNQVLLFYSGLTVSVATRS